MTDDRINDDRFFYLFWVVSYPFKLYMLVIAFKMLQACCASESSTYLSRFHVREIYLYS